MKIKKYVNSVVQNRTDDFYVIKRDEKKFYTKKSTYNSLKKLKTDLEQTSAIGKTINIGIAAQEIYKNYKNKTKSFCAKLHYLLSKSIFVIRKIFQRKIEFKLDQERNEIKALHKAIISEVDHAAREVHLGSPANTLNSLFNPNNSNEQLETVITVIKNFKDRLNDPLTQQRITESRRKENEKIYQQLIDELKADLSIPREFIEAVENAWTGQINTLIPKEVKENKVLFSDHLKKQILSASKEATSKKIKQQLKELESKILEDFHKGRITPSEKVIKTAYQEFFQLLKKAEEGGKLSPEELKKWKLQYNDIVNKAYLENEIIKYKKEQEKGLVKRVSGNSIERILLSALSNTTIEEKNNNNFSKLKVLETLLTGHDLDKISIEELKNQVSYAQQEERIRNVGIPQNSIKRTILLIDQIQTKYNEEQHKAISYRDIECLKQLANPKTKKPIEKLKKSKERSIKNSINIEFSNKIKEKEFISDVKKYHNFKLDNLTLDQFIINSDQFKDFSIKFEKNYTGSIQFYREFGEDLAMEFDQSDDINEALGDGVCWAKSSRWVADEVNYADANEVNHADNKLTDEFIKKHHWNEIIESDRFIQAFEGCIHYFKVADNNFDSNKIIKFLNKEVIPKKIRTKLKIKPIATTPHLVTTSVDNEKGLTDFWKLELLNYLNIETDALERSEGAALLGISKHAIYMRYDLKRNVYRIGDPNFGIIEFNKGTLEERRKKFFDCFAFFMLFYKTDHCIFTTFLKK